VLAVKFLVIFSRGPETDAHQPFGVHFVGKSKKVDKARLLLQNRYYVIL